MKIKTMQTRPPLRSSNGRKPRAKQSDTGMFISSKTKAEWQVEDDARTLSRYQEIIDDPKRKAAAMKRAAQIADDLSKRADAMKRASKGCSDV